MVRDFLIVIENTKRGELDNACLLAAELEKRGYCVEIVLRQCILNYFKKARVVILPYCYSDFDIKDIAWFKGNHIEKILNLQYEQVLSVQGDNSTLYSMSGKAKNICFICWGEKTKERLLSKGIEEKNLFVTGHMSMDFYGEKFNDFIIPKKNLAEEFGLDKTRRWHMFASSFAYADEGAQERGAVEKLFDMDVETIAETLTSIKGELLRFLPEILDKLDGDVFIYRPHPTEGNDPRLQKLCEQYDNFFCIGKYPIKHWINACDTYGTCTSTSIVDAYVMGVRSYVFRPVNLREDIDNRIYSGAKTIKTIQELKDFLLGADEKNDFPIRKELIEGYYGKTFDFLTYQRIADVCEKIYFDDSYSLRCDDLQVEEGGNKVRVFIREIVRCINYNIPLEIFFRFDKKIADWLADSHFQFQEIKKNKDKKIKQIRAIIG